MDNSVTLLLDDFDIYRIGLLLRDRICVLESNQDRLLSLIFECRQKILLASLGVKWSFIRGWYKTGIYVNDMNVKTAGKDLIANATRLREEYSSIKSYCKLYNQIIVHDNKMMEIQPSTQDDKISNHWSDLIKVLDNLGEKLSRLECEGRLTRIATVWSIEETEGK
jgi:hypothetical protein